MARGRWGTALLGGIAAALIGAPTALAGGSTTRYAEPGGNGAGACLLSDPCSLQDAVNGAPLGATVLMTPGTYTESSTVTVDDNVDLRSQTGAVADVTIDSSANVAVSVTSNSSELEDFTIEHDTPIASGSYGLQLGTGIARRLFVDSGDRGQFACHVAGEGLLRDSICVNTATVGGHAAGLSTPVDAFPTLTNVTAVATNGVGVLLAATASGADPILTGRNVIAEGPLTDQQVSAVTGASATVNLFNSNFDSGPSPVGAGGTEDGTLNTENDNQAAPELLDANYRQLPGSPTRNAGDNSAAFGAAGDVDGDIRIQEGLVDIGGDEFAVPPTTTITQKPRKRTRKRKATFAFTSNDDFANTFECKLDSGPFATCSSPKVYRNLRRKKHTFRVRAVDVVGTADPSPAEYTWKIRKRRR